MRDPARTSAGSPPLAAILCHGALLACALLLPCRLGGADPLGDPLPAEQLDAGTEQADALVQLGNRAMQDSNTTPGRAVDAALAFAKALTFYQAAGRSARVRELEADIFWCKKRMDLDEVRRFLAAKGSSSSDAELIALADQIAARQVAVQEDQDYFARAQDYASEHPTDFAQIASRFFEVAERFPASALAAKAKALEQDALAHQAAALAAERQRRLETVFSRPPPAGAPGALIAYPPAEALKAAVAEVRSLYKADYLKHRPAQKAHFARRLLDEARGGAPAKRAALLNEAIGVAASAGDDLLVIAIADRIAAIFSGGSVSERRKQALALAPPSPFVAAMARLVDAPDDQEANLAVGRQLCEERGEWEAGIPLLARGSDPELSALAASEINRPEGAVEQVELADRWYAQARRTFAHAKEQVLAHAFSWYQQAKPGLSGASKERVGRLIEEIGDALPPTNLDYDKLTLKQWERIASKVWALPAGNPRNDIGLVLTKGVTVRIVPNPVEQWTMNYGRYRWPRGQPPIFATDWTGYDATSDTRRTLGSRIPIGALVAAIGNGAAQSQLGAGGRGQGLHRPQPAGRRPRRGPDPGQGGDPRGRLTGSGARPRGPCAETACVHARRATGHERAPARG